MRRIRSVAAILAILTALIDALFSFDHVVNAPVVVCTALAAACLAVAVPFDALDPPARKRIVMACVAHVLLIGIGLAFALQAAAELAPLAALAGLAAGGFVLSIWSYRTRNRHRRSGWSNYFDA